MLSFAAAQSQEAAKPQTNKRFYARFGAGYGFTHAGQTSILLTSNGSIYFNGSSASASGVAGTSESTSLKRGSFGAGGALALAGGYMLTRHIGIELGAEAVVLPKKYEYNNVQTGNFNYTGKQTTSANLPVYLMPSVLMTTGGKGASLYGRVGLALPFADKMTIKSETVSFNATTDATYELTQRFSVGFQGAAGLSYPVGNNLRLWVEAAGLFRNAYAKKLELTRAVQNGVNVLSQVPANQKVIEFDYNLTNATGVTPNPSAPSKELTSAAPYSSIGAKFGLTIDF